MAKKIRDIPGITTYDIQTNTYFPETAEELEEYLRAIASSYVGDLISNPDHIIHEIEHRLDNILAEAMNRGLTEKQLYCWVEFNKITSSIQIELKKDKRPVTEMIPFFEMIEDKEDLSPEQLQLELQDFPEEHELVDPDDGEVWTKKELLEFDIYGHDEDD